MIKSILFTNTIQIGYFVYIIVSFAILIICYILYVKNKSEKALKKHLQILQNRIIKIERETLRNRNLLDKNYIESYSCEKIISLITHDIRSPLCALQNTTKIFEYYIKEKDYTQLLELCTEVDLTIGNLNFMMDNLINWNLSRTNRLYSNPISCLLSDIINQSIEFNKMRAIKKNIIIEYSSIHPIPIRADYNLLYNICNNVLNNAIKYSEENSIVNIKEFSNKKNIDILFSDAGLGISNDQISAFNNGLQIAQRIGTNGEKGFGFGLSLSKSLAEICNINISVRKNYPQGTDVVLHLKHQT